MKLNSFEKLVTMLTLQAANLPTYQAQVGATNADIEEINKDLANLEYVRDYADLIEANKETVFQIKQALYSSVEDEEIPPFPNFPAAAPPNSLIADCLGRAQKRNRRFKSANGYTKEIGIALGIDGDSQSIAPESVKPTIQTSAAQTGYLFSVIVSNRGESDMWDVLIMKKGGTWTKAGSFTGKSGDVVIAPTTQGEAEQIQVRVQLRKANANYGQPSDIVYVTVNP